MKLNFTRRLIFVLIGVGLFAQFSRAQGGELRGRFYGKVVDKSNKKGIEAASVQLFLVGTQAGNGDSLVGGMLTKPNGDFSVANLPVAGKFRLVISAIGYQQSTQTIAFSLPAGGNQGRPGEISLERDLGNIALQADAQYLNSVTVVGQKPTLQMGIDRKVFNVDKNITSSGGTAIDIMKNIPSVSVDVDGNVLLRNASPQIFVDGLPTILTLDQIPADNIERIELITNPSAKFDASSSAGIINVILKKNKRKGMNGIVSAGIGTPGIYNGSLTLNHREGKVNIFASANYNRSGGVAAGSSLRQNKLADTVVNYFDQNTNNDRVREFRSVRFGADFFIDNRNTLTLSQNFVNGRFSNLESQDQQYFNSVKVKERIGDRTSDSRFGFNRSSTQAAWKHNFAEKGKELTADINFNSGNGSNQSSILNSYFYPDGSVYMDPTRVRNYGGDDNNQLTAQVNFTDPKGEKSKLEAGLRTYINNYRSTFTALAVDPTGVETKLPLSNNYKYREMVHAAYFTYSDKWKDYRFQLGLRTEISQFDGEMIDSAQKFGYKYPNSIKNLFDGFFPSIFITKSISDGVDIQVNYTRRIRRPNFWQLNPFVDINDPLNLRQGNPALQPEFTNSFEFNYNNTYSSGNFLATVYYRNNQRDITRYSDTISQVQYQKLQNAGVDPNAILNTYINARSTNRLGAEFTLQQRFGPDFDISPSVDMQYRKVNVDQTQLSLSNEGFNWDAKLMANYKIQNKPGSVFNKLSFQLSGQYESAEVTAQGRNLSRYSADFALRKDLFKNNKGSIVFAINDIFNSNRFGNIYDTELFYQESFRRWNVRNFRLTFTYKFGDNNFSLFRRNKSENGGEQAPEGQDSGY